MNKDILALEPSKSVALLALVKKMQAEDPNVLNLTAGDPDFSTPEAVCEEAFAWLKKGYTHYTPSQGDADLREAIAKKLQEENQAAFTADDIIITPGGKFAVYLAVRTLLARGEEAIWLTPGWVSYPAIITASGGVPKAVHLDYAKEYKITAEQLEKAVSEKTRLLILNYPNNPTGKILSAEEAEEIAVFLRRHPDLYVLSDEMYEKIVFDGVKSVSVASCPEFSDRVMIVNGYSKSAAMTGWRIGYLACKGDILKNAMKLFSHTMSCTSGFVQKAALKAMSCAEETEAMRRTYEARRNLLVEGFKTIPHTDFQSPEGAFYAWVRFDVKEDAGAFAEKLLREAKIGCIPGNAFGAEDACYLRFTFAASEEVLKEMLVRLKAFMEKY